MAIATSLGAVQRPLGLYHATDGYNPSTDIYKDHYLPYIRNVVNSKRILMRYMRRKRQEIYGNVSVIALRTGRNEGINSIDELGAIPDPEGQVYDRATYRVRRMYTRIKVSGAAMAASNSSDGAWINALEGEMTGAIEDIQHEMNRICHGDGSGRLCRVVAPAAFGVVIDCDLPGGFGFNQSRGTKYLREGMKVAMIQPAIVSPGYSGTFGNGGGIWTFWVYNIDYENSTFQLSSTNPRGPAGPTAVTITAFGVTPVAGGEIAYLVRASVGGLTAAPPLTDVAYMKEPYGLAAFASDLSVFPNVDGYHFGGIDPGDVPEWRSYQIDNGGVPMPFNQNDLQSLINGVDQNGDGDINLFITSFGIQQRYGASLTANKRYVKQMELDGGYTALEFAMRPIVADKDSIGGRIYGLDQEVMYHFDQTDWHWIAEDGSVLHRMPDQHAYQATLVKFCNFGTDARNRLGLIADVEDF